MSSMNRNPSGKNQHQSLPTLDDPELVELLRKLVQEKKTNSRIAEIVGVDFGLNFPPSTSTVKRWRKGLDLPSSKTVAKTVPKQVLEQAVLNQMDKDPSNRHGVRSVWAMVSFETGLQIPRRLVSEVMHVHAPEGFGRRAPEGRNIVRTAKAPLGPNERWSCDGHDKLKKIGCQIYGIVDDATSRYLGMWVVPSNREGSTVAYLYLSLVLEYGGIPIQTATDFGSETTQMAGLQKALRDKYRPDGYNVEAHSYVPSTRNIAVERSWRRLREDWGDNAFAKFEAGIDNGFYDPDVPEQRKLACWLFSFVFQQGLNEAVAFRNARATRRDGNKPGPSGISRDDAFHYPYLWGGRDDLLIPVDRDVVSAMRDEVYDEDMLKFVDDDFAARALNALTRLNLTPKQATMDNAWVVFQQLLPLIS